MLPEVSGPVVPLSLRLSLVLFDCPVYCCTPFRLMLARQLSLKSQVSMWPHAELGQRMVGFLSLVNVARGACALLSRGLDNEGHSLLIAVTVIKEGGRLLFVLPVTSRIIPR